MGKRNRLRKERVASRQEEPRRTEKYKPTPRLIRGTRFVTKEEFLALQAGAPTKKQKDIKVPPNSIPASHLV